LSVPLSDRLACWRIGQSCPSWHVTVSAFCAALTLRLASAHRPREPRVIVLRSPRLATTPLATTSPASRPVSPRKKLPLAGPFHAFGCARMTTLFDGRPAPRRRRTWKWGNPTLARPARSKPARRLKSDLRHARDAPLPPEALSLRALNKRCLWGVLVIGEATARVCRAHLARCQSGRPAAASPPSGAGSPAALGSTSTRRSAGTQLRKTRFRWAVAGDRLRLDRFPPGRVPGRLGSLASQPESRPECRRGISTRRKRSPQCPRSP